ncbi:MAG TPA: hypothetical protein VKU38_19120 [Ktedonobacteraceae bacterium]|nr:hypothetical protein [Ktedonobacteraceae bacterium]
MTHSALSGAQARVSCSYPHGDTSGTYSSVARYVWQPWQRGLQRQTAASHSGDHQLCDTPGLPTSTVLVRLDGWYGDAAPLLDVLSADLGVIARSRAYHLSDLGIVQQHLLRTPDHVSTHPESGMVRALYDCPAVPLTPTGPEVRLVVATHDATSSSPDGGVERDDTVYVLTNSTFSTSAFTASDVLDLYLHRGSFETLLADEDDGQDADRWYSHTPCGQEFAQILAQWIWNLRLELLPQLTSTEVRTTEFAHACEDEPASADEPAPQPLAPVLWKDWSRCSIGIAVPLKVRTFHVKETHQITPDPIGLDTIFGQISTLHGRTHKSKIQIIEYELPRIIAFTSSPASFRSRMILMPASGNTILTTTITLGSGCHPFVGFFWTSMIKQDLQRGMKRLKISLENPEGLWFT